MAAAASSGVLNDGFLILNSSSKIQNTAPIVGGTGKLTTGRCALFLCVMRTFSIMETQHHLSRVLQVVEAGQSVGITRRKQLVAKIVPLQAEIGLPDFVSRARRVWGKSWKGAPSEKLLEEARGAR
jgi:antitoxin (DNA-binding transcriptional repressor) of toxin-antitoxin stability system